MHINGFRIAAVALACTVLGGAVAHAQDGGGHGAPTMQSTLTTFDDQTRAELQEWASIFWEWYDTGIIPPGAETFAFTHPAQFPRWFHPLNPALTVFRDIYRHRLPPDEYGYAIGDLLEHDPLVMQHFREYTTTGVLRTPTFEDPQAAAHHLERLQQAQSGQSTAYTLLGHWEITESTTVTSDGLVTKKKIPNPPAPGVDPTPLPGIPGDIQDSWDDSGIYRMPYTPDGWPWEPGFDCDDYADALAAWLRHYLVPEYEGMTVEIIWITWFGGGHAIVRVCYNGACWYVDPQTGEILPCISSCTVRDIIEWFNDVGYEIGDPWFPGWYLKDPNERPWFEPNPWWHNPEYCDLIESHTGHSCDDFIWNAW